MPGVPADADLPPDSLPMRWLEPHHPLVRALQRRYPTLSIEVTHLADDQRYCLKFGAPDRATLEAACVISREHLAVLLALSGDARRERAVRPSVGTAWAITSWHMRSAQRCT